MAHKKAGGSTSLGRDSESKRLGVKIFGGQEVRIGNVIIRQRGTKYDLGKNVAKGSDDTIFSLKDGKVQFKNRVVKRFDGNLKSKTIVSVV